MVHSCRASLLRGRSVRIVALAILTALLFGAQIRANAIADGASDIPAAVRPACSMIYAGFVGAFEPAGHKNNGVVQIRNLLSGPGYADVCAASFIPGSWPSGRDWILTHFASHPGPLTAAEAANCPRVILVGHSMGGWAVLNVARALRAKNIPVELTIQIDSVGITDHTVPSNVRYSAIFHAWDALAFMTTKNVKLEDPKYTTTIADVLVRDANHLSITRDPRIRELVLNSVKTLRAEAAARAPAIHADAAKITPTP
jgi:pimeloyl-ACP methyl ester carboxylesterase